MIGKKFGLNEKRVLKFSEFIISEDWHEVAKYVSVAFFFYKFLQGVWRSHKDKIHNNRARRIVMHVLHDLQIFKNIDNKISVTEYDDRYFIRIDEPKYKIDLRLLKKEKILYIATENVNKDDQVVIPLDDEEFLEFLKLLK